MHVHKKIGYLLPALAAIIMLPYFGALIKYHGHLPSTFFDYPPLKPSPVAPFSWIVFGIIAFLFAGTALVYLVPSLFGFKKTEAPAVTVHRAKAPLWFWLGLVMWGVPIALLWTGCSQPKFLLYYSDLPLFWGFTFILDGWVYMRNGGHSILADNPREMIGIGSASVSGWMIFEFLNFYIHMNWYYPKGDLIANNRFLLYALIGSSGLLPMAFEWYELMLTVKWLRYRFSSGKKVTLPGWLKIVLLISSFAGMFILGIFPDQFFYALWLWPLIILTVLLQRINIWTPFTPVKDGNWTPLLLFALAYLVQGIVMEGWNYLSGTHAGGVLVNTYTPAYWVYNIPYVYTYKIFEMPLLGYLGYMPFSVYCWIYWIMYAYLQGIPTKYYDHTQTHKLPE